MRCARGDRIFAGGVTGLALIVPLTVAGITALMVEAAWPSITRHRLGLGGSSPCAAPVEVGAAICLVGYPPRRVAGTLAFLIEVLAYIPSIVYGLWGLFVLVPLFRENVEPALQSILGAVPTAQREAMFGIGATKWEMVRGAVLPYARTGIIGAIVLGLARAFGETMAVTLVV